MRRRLLLLAWLGLTLAGCAVQRQIPGTSVGWDTRRSGLAALPGWELRGRIAVKSGDKGGQGNIDWQQRPDSARLRLSGPFGMGAYEIRWNASEIVITDAGGEVAAAYTGPDAADQFVRNELGWFFPAVNARYWVLGVPAPDTRHEEIFDPDGWLVGIEQQGWSIRYDGYVRRGDFWLPRKVTLQRPDGRVRLVVDDWQSGEGG